MTSDGRRALLMVCAVIVACATAIAAGQAQPTVQPAPDLVADLVAANRILVMEGVLDGMGHVSVRDPRRPGGFLLARSIAPELVTAGDILEYGADGEPFGARGRTSYLERFIHSEIYRVRPDVQAIVHCHTPSLIPFAASDVPVRAMYHMAAFVAEGVPVFDIRKAGGVTDLLVRDAPARPRAREATGHEVGRADAGPRRRRRRQLDHERTRTKRVSRHQRARADEGAGARRRLTYVEATKRSCAWPTRTSTHAWISGGESLDRALALLPDGHQGRQQRGAPRRDQRGAARTAATARRSR